jgi:hypothetical protein
VKGNERRPNPIQEKVVWKKIRNFMAGTCTSWVTVSFSKTTLLIGVTKHHTAVSFGYRIVYNNEHGTALSYAKWQSRNRNTLLPEGSKSTCKLKNPVIKLSSGRANKYFPVLV